MYALPTIEMYETRELERELKTFFTRLRYMKQQLQLEGSSLPLNRLQRSRCKSNLMLLERLEKDFYALSYQDDILHIYRKLQGYVKLDYHALVLHLGHKRVEVASLFTAL